LKKLTIAMVVLVFSLVFAMQGFAAGILGANNIMGTSSTTSTDNTGSGSILGGNRGVGAGTMGTTGVTGTGMLGTQCTPGISGTTGTGTYGTSAYGTSTYGISPTTSPTYGSYGSYPGTSRIMSSPGTYGGTSSTSYNTNGTMRGYNYRTNAATNTNNNNWGWLGLLGLLGLMGLRRNNEHRDREREHSGGKH
jgi:hypothetical protein